MPNGRVGRGITRVDHHQAVGFVAGTDTDTTNRRADGWTTFIVAYAFVAALFQPLTWPAAVAVLIPGLVVLVLRVRRPAAALPPDAYPKRAGVVWGVLLAALAVWEAVALFGPNDAEHPSLSLLLDPALEHYPVRVLGYLLWLTTGRWLVTR